MRNVRCRPAHENQSGAIRIHRIYRRGTILVGLIGFNLGVDIPRLRASLASPAIARPRVDPVELLSATGTFLATVAALDSLYALVFDEAPQQTRATW